MSKMASRPIQVLVAAQRASSFPSRQRYLPNLPDSCISPQTQRLLSSHKADSPPKDASSPFSLWGQIREARPAVRYTVYAGLGLMATAESTFWFNVIKAKYFPSSSGEGQEKDERFLEEFRAALSGYRAVWMRNYGRYYGAYTWGLGYGGLDAL